MFINYVKKPASRTHSVLITPGNEKFAASLFVFYSTGDQPYVKFTFHKDK